jgi:uncharacterized damage-inducible protein DinB
VSVALASVRKLMRYTSWANNRLFVALEALPPEVLEAPRPGAGGMLRTLNHAVVVDRIWRAHLEATPHGFEARNTPRTPPLAEVRRAQRELDAWYEKYAAGLDAATYDEVVRFTFVGGGAGAMTRGEILLHVANHKTYHRGYVADMIYQSGGKPPTMDLPVFVRDVEPH